MEGYLPGLAIYANTPCNVQTSAPSMNISTSGNVNVFSDICMEATAIFQANDIQYLNVTIRQNVHARATVQYYQKSNNVLYISENTKVTLSHTF